MVKQSTLSDEEIVEVVRSSDKNKYRVIVERYQDKLYRYVFRMTKDNDVTNDIVQQAFIKAYKNLQGFDTKRKFSSWIYRITHNETMNYFQKNKRNIKIDDASLLDKLLHREQVTDRDEVESEELKQIMQEVINELPINYSAPLSLFYYEDKSYEEISEILHIPVNTVGTRIRRGRAKAKELYLRKTNNGERKY